VQDIMSVAPLPSDFVRARPLVPETERRPKSTAERPFATGARPVLAPVTAAGGARGGADEDFMWQLVASLSDLRGYARRLTGDASDASDLVQETCRRAIESRELFIAGSDIRAWLCCIVRNLYRDRLRRLSREVLVSDYEQSPAWAPERRPSWALVSDEDLALALASLQPQYQQTYVLYAVGGRSYQEIARRLHVSSSTVGTRILRARLLLREFLMKRIEAQSGGIAPSFSI
jgi:RNA polymerase sigma-70 factor (ECF subfamily)